MTIEDLIVLIVTATVCICVISVFIASIFLERPITEEGGRIVGNILLVMLGMISGYITKSKVDKYKKKNGEKNES